MSRQEFQLRNDRAASKSENHKLKVVISGIGTGGHFFPAIVVAQELLKRKVEVIFLVRKGYFKKEDNVLFVHTGGSPALYVYQDYILSA